MKKLLFILIVLFTICGIAQPPANYYSSATGSGYQLKTQLHEIIKNHTTKSYNSLWGLYLHTAYRDLYYENDNTLLDVYSEKPVILIRLATTNVEIIMAKGVAIIVNT